MYGGEIGDEGEESLENLELYVDALGHAVVHRLDDGRDGRERDGAEGDEALERAEGNRDHLYIFGCTTHENRAKEVFCVPPICPHNVRSRIGSSSGVKIEAQPTCDAMQRVLGTNTEDGNVPETRLAVTCSGEDRSRERDFSAAYTTATYQRRTQSAHTLRTSRTSGYFLLVSVAKDLGGSSKRGGRTARGDATHLKLCDEESEGAHWVYEAFDRSGLRMRITWGDVSGARRVQPVYAAASFR